MPRASSTTPAGFPPAGSSLKAAYLSTVGGKPGSLVGAKNEVEQARIVALDVLAPERRVARAAAHLLLDQPGLAQHLEVVARRRLRDRQVERPARAPLVLGRERADDLQADRVAQRSH